MDCIFLKTYACWYSISINLNKNKERKTVRQSSFLPTLSLREWGVVGSCFHCSEFSWDCDLNYWNKTHFCTLHFWGLSYSKHITNTAFWMDTNMSPQFFKTSKWNTWKYFSPPRKCLFLYISVSTFALFASNNQNYFFCMISLSKQKWKPCSNSIITLSKRFVFLSITLWGNSFFNIFQFNKKMK